MARHVLGLPVPLFCVAVAPNGRVFAAGGGGESRTGVTNQVFELGVSSDGTLRQVRSIDTGPFAVMNMAVSPLSDLLATGEEASAHLYELRGDDIVSLRHVVTDQAESAPRQRAVVFNSAGDMFATTGEDAKIRVWKCQSLKRERTFTGHTRAVRSLDFNSYSSQVVSVSEDGTIKTWQVASGAMLRSVAASSILAGGVLRACAFARNNRELVVGLTANDAAHVCLLNAETGNTLSVARLLPGRMNCMATSPCGRFVAVSAGEEGVVCVYTFERSEIMLTVRVGSFPLTAMAFTPDSRFVVAVSMDGYVRSVRVFPQSRWLAAFCAVLVALLAALAAIWRLTRAAV